jgi:hypothetical protein
MALRTDLNDVKRRKPFRHRDPNFDLSAVQLLASPYTD